MAVTGILESWSGPRGRKGEGPRVCPCVCVSGRQQVLGSAVNHRSLSQHRGSGALGRTGLQLPLWCLQELIQARMMQPVSSEVKPNLLQDVNFCSCLFFL